MSVTFSAMANVASQTAQSYGLAQANSMGLGQTEANALAVTNLMGGDSGGMSAGPTNKQEFGAAVVTQTTNNLNSGKKSSGLGVGMDFQMKVLGAGLASKGLNISSMV